MNKEGLPEEPEALDESLERRRREGARDLGLDDASALPLVRLLGNRTGLSKLPEKRRRRFREHLVRVVEEAFGAPPPSSPRAPSDEPSPEVAPLLEGACATCRGRCCQAGREHAFVDRETIQRFRGANPEASAEEVVLTYLAHLGEETYDRACVFQGALGCTLPRSMRAGICNSFFCTPLLELQKAAERMPIRHALVAALHGERLVRLQIVGGSPQAGSRAV